ncbi:MAG: GGDEF domain-containing protein [Cyanobium sp.]
MGSSAPTLNGLDGGSGPRRRSRLDSLPWLALLSGLGVLLNAWPVPLYYGVHLLLGSVPATLALLLWRTWWAVPMGLLAALQTWRLWNHPWAVVIFVLEMVWLSLAMLRWNGPAGQEGNGRVVLFSIAYWLLLGCPLVLLFYGLVLGIDTANVAVVAIKQAFNGVFNTVLAFSLLVLIRAIQSGHSHGPGVSLRGVIMTVAMLAITLPTLLIGLVAGSQLENAVETGALEGLQTVNLAISRTGALQENTQLLIRQLGESIAYRRIEADGRSISSNPALFLRLDNEFRDSGRDNVHQRDLAMLVPKTPGPALRRWVNGYWSYSHQYIQPGGDTFLVQVVEPARTVVTRLQQQSTWLLMVTFAVMLMGSGAGLWLGRLFEREFRKVAQPLTQQHDQLQVLRLSAVSELRTLAQLINHRILQVNRLSRQLRRANDTLRQSRQELKELLRSDPLTGCGNRAALDLRLQEEVDRCGRSLEPLSCLMIDVEDLRGIKHQHGRRAVNALLRGLAEAARQRLRRTDHLFRWREDGFLVLAIGCPPDAAAQLGQLLVEAMTAVYLTPVGGRSSEAVLELRVALTLGISSLEAGADSAQAMLDRAAQALAAARPPAGS